MQSATNVKLGRKEDRSLLYVFYQTLHFPTYLFIIHRTGVHSVADVFCLGCDERLGWFYHKAADHLQKYKEGTYILLEYFSLLSYRNMARKVPSRAGEACKRKCVDLGR
jgi:Yippee zinc-binding/DNA-binding /Mis18, centromere assembly